MNYIIRAISYTVYTILPRGRRFELAKNASRYDFGFTSNRWASYTALFAGRRHHFMNWPAFSGVISIEGIVYCLSGTNPGSPKILVPISTALSTQSG